MLSRRTAVSTNEEALRQITTANGLIRRGRRLEAERLFRQVLAKHSPARSPADQQAQADALVGLSDASVGASRQRTKEPVEQFWFLVRGLCFLRRAKELLKDQMERQGASTLAYEGLQSKSRTVHSEAYNLLRQTLLGKAPREDTFGRHGNSYRRRRAFTRPSEAAEKEEKAEEAGESLSAEEKGRQFLESFFNFCSCAERRYELLRDAAPGLPDLDGLSGGGLGRPGPGGGQQQRLRWLTGASRISASMMDLSAPDPNPEQRYYVQEADDSGGLSSSSIREEVEGTLDALRQRFGIAGRPADPGADPTERDRLSSMVRDHRRRMDFLASKEAQHVIEYEAQNIVANLRLRRAASREALGVEEERPTGQEVALADGGPDPGREVAPRASLGGVKLRRATSMMDTSTAGLSKRHSYAEGQASPLSGERRRPDPSDAILRRRSVRRLQRSASRESLSSPLSLSCLNLNEVVEGTYQPAESSFQSAASRYRQMRLEREALGMEPCHVEELEEEEEEDGEDAEAARKARQRQEFPEEPGVAQLHAEWIYTLVHFANRLDAEDDVDGAATVLGHTLFLYEMLERDVVELEVMAFVMRRLGAIRCHRGNLGGGISLMERALAVYADLPNADSAMMEQAAVWLEMGNAYLHGVRGLDLARRAISMAVRRHMARETMRPEDRLLDAGGEGEAEEAVLGPSAPAPDDEEVSANARQALSCYKRCLAMLEFVPEALRPKGFRERLLTRLGDCHLILGDGDEAGDFYEKAQELFAGTAAAGMLEENAHVLCMLGIGRFLTANYAKALAVLEAAYVILYHQSMKEEVRRAPGASVFRDTRYFITALLALCYARTEHHYKTLNWCTRSLGFFRGQFGEAFAGLLEENDSWLLCQVLMVQAKVLAYFARHDEALTNYRRAIGLVDEKLGGDVFLKSSLYKVMGDSFVARGRREDALALYQQAVAVLDSYDDHENFGVSFQKAKLFSTLGHTLVDLKRRSEGSDFLRQSASLQCAIQDELTSSVVALQYEMAVHALHDFNHDRAFALLTDALQMYSEEHGRLGPDMAPVLSQLAMIHHLRALTNDEDWENAAQGDARFRESLCLDDDPALSLKYAYFLWDQHRTRDAMDRVEALLRRPALAAALVTYEPHEELLVPQPLDREMAAAPDDAVDFPAQAFALFLLLNFYREAGWGALMDAVTAWLWRLAEREGVAMHWSILGYALMEYQLFGDAAWAFGQAAALQEFGNAVTIDNLLVSLAIVYGRGLHLQRLAAEAVRRAARA